MKFWRCGKNYLKCCKYSNIFCHKLLCSLCAYKFFISCFIIISKMEKRHIGQRSPWRPPTCPLSSQSTPGVPRPSQGRARGCKINPLRFLNHPLLREHQLFPSFSKVIFSTKTCSCNIQRCFGDAKNRKFQ